MISAHRGTERGTSKMNRQLYSYTLLVLFVLILTSGCSNPKKDWQKDVYKSIQELQNKSPSVRQEAALALGKLKDARAVEPLIAGLRDKNSGFQLEAASALGEIRDARAVDPLVAILGDRRIQDYAVEALAKIGAPAVTTLIAALSNEDSWIRFNAAKALGEIRDVRAVEPLIGALTDNEVYVRSRAAGALGEMKDTRAVEPLIAALKTKYTSVRERAADALGKIKDPRAVKLLIAALKDGDHNVRCKADEALAKFELSTSTIKSLIAALKDQTNDGWIGEGSVGNVLARIGTPTVKLLIDALKDENASARGMVAAVLGNIDTLAVDALIVALKNRDPNVRAGAAEALQRIKDGRVVEPLIAALNDKDWLVRDEATRALGKNKDARAVGPMVAALKNRKDADVQLAMDIGEALSEIGDDCALEALSLALKNGDSEVIVGASDYFIRQGQPGSEAILIRALNKCGWTSMAEKFLNSGNSKLSDAGLKWAKRHNCQIDYFRPPVQGPTWGSRR
jgi:HEAT repeat protein